MPMLKIQRRKNFGEWSEVYALAYILSNRGGYGADENQEANMDIFYKVLSVLFKKEINGEDLVYLIGDTDVFIYNNKEKKGNVSRPKLAKLASNLHKDLLVPHIGAAFPLSSGDMLLSALMKGNASAVSMAHNDIYLKIEDKRTEMETPFIGFSIKSQLNAKATLLNASGATNFVFEIVANRKFASGLIPDFGKSLKDDMQKLVSLGYTLKFKKIDNEIHHQNMALVDSNLSKYMAACLFETTQHSNNLFSRIAELVFPISEKENAAVILKLKQYLGYIMLGMKPTKPWSGQPSDFGGLILVKKSGDVLFYYLYNMADFQNFLFINLKFEYGGRDRHGFGIPYQEDGKNYIKLNLQLRFV